VSGGTALDPAAIRARLASAAIGVRTNAGPRAGGGGTGSEEVRSAAARIRGDHDLNPNMGPLPLLRPAAVLVPIVLREAGPTVLLTRRSPNLADHAGQISFPGGRLEPEDPDATAAALREAAEEIGLAREHVDVVGRIDTYQTRTGYEITPVVGFVSGPFTLLIDPAEVVEAFEVPLAFVIDRANHVREQRSIKGATREFWAIPYQDYYIWGATAGMLVNLSEILGD
jgi:8-oxo-dGTP pyrophosphatase MutT (NUDIX family)